MNHHGWTSYFSKAIILICIFLLTAGCWDRQEIEERAVVLGIGIDPAEPGAAEEEAQISHKKGALDIPEHGMIQLTVQVAVPGRIPLGPGAGGEGGGKRTVWVVSGVGHTIDDAINGLQQRIASPLFFGHLRVIVVSEKVAQKGMQNINDYFRRNPDIRRMSWMFISKGSTTELMKASPQLERVPTLYLMTTMDQAVKMGRFPNDFLGLFWSSVSAKGKEGYLPYAELKGQDSLQISGLAYFRGDKLVGSAQPVDIILLMGIMGMNPAGGQAFVKIPGTSDYLEFSARSRKVFTKVDIQDGQPHVRVKIMLEGNIREKSTEEVKLDHTVIQTMEKQLNKDAQKAYLDLIRRTQEKGSDIFGFGEKVRARKWKYWDQHIKTKEKWQQMYPDIKVDLTVQVEIRRVGMKAV
ncbi:Ger(x)C family spore germination protein [Paenibacillus sedimenti]|uniref:Ger(X)C family spore germination protein n=1 Tax=Paenibacillus sedimenti TaxID=2770274 RepID=A0A926QIQ1_9BACL|nr:Ger(x)C family spore germination protein [Paenibacillus sedimenti]MBD0379572.1 Ger(x)C family spore germination protein [Paenibacillus sedimenti]